MKGLPLALMLYVFLSIFPFFTPYLYALVLLRLFSDFLIVFNPLRILRQHKLLPYFLLFHINLILSTIFVGMALLFSTKIIWKGRVIE